MRRRVVILVSGLTVAACSYMPSMDFMKPSPVVATVQFESEPAGAEAKTSLGPSCRTPCSIPVSASSDFTVTFALAGYQSQTVPVQLKPPDDPRVDPSPRLAPNPVSALLEALPPSGKRKPAVAAKKPSSAPKRAKPPVASTQQPDTMQATPSSPFPPPSASPFPPPPTR